MTEMCCPALAPATPKIRRSTIREAQQRLRQIERRNQIAVEHLALAHQIADRAMRVMPTWVDRDDARLAAEHALLRCADEYRDRLEGYEQDGDFRGYATRRIYYAVLMARRREYKHQSGREVVTSVSQHAVYFDRHRVGGAQAEADNAFQQFAPWQGRVVASDGPDPEAIAERVKMAGIVRQCTQILTPRQIAVVVLHYWHGMTLVEVAERMGISSPWASIQHTRALRAMREWMEWRGIHGAEC
jgi:RNA polymerase sigma factor (sigma-70 family)